MNKGVIYKLLEGTTEFSELPFQLADNIKNEIHQFERHAPDNTENPPSDFFTKQWVNDVLNSKSSVFGPLERNKDEAIRKGVRFRSWDEIYKGWYASSTLNTPNTSGALFALYTRSQMQKLLSQKQSISSSDENTIFQLHLMCTSIIELLSKTLLNFYNLDSNLYEIIFDENATTALFNLISTENIKSNPCYVTFYDTGRPVPPALLHDDPKNKPGNNFTGTIRIGQGSETILKDTPGKLHLVSHYSNGVFKDDLNLTNEILEYVVRENPSVVIIPTLTRTGRIIPYREIGREIKKLNSDILYILDDAQGLGRLDHQRYSDVSDYTDGILGTGAKVIGSLSGAGFIIVKKGMISDSSNREELIAKRRLKQYGYYTGDAAVMKKMSYNLNKSETIVSIPELASFLIAFKKYFIKVGSNKPTQQLKSIRKQCISALSKLDMIKVFDYSNIEFDPSIIAFDSLKIPPLELKKKIQDDNSKMIFTLPALITTNEESNTITSVEHYYGNETNMKHSLRISLDPYRVEEQRKNLPELLTKISNVTGGDNSI